MGINNQQKSGGKKAAGGMLGVVLLVTYWFAQPVLNDQLGLNLPSLRGTTPAAQEQQDAPPQTPEAPAVATPAVDSLASEEKAAKDQPQPDLLHGILREVQPDRYMSPAGLLYGPGSQEGHRLKHLERHTQDQPTRPGSHGVFDGGMPAALKVIDEGFSKTKSGGSGITSEEDGDRTIYTISMGKRIGFIGGRDGNRRNKPMARRLRIVLEGNRVITAFPL